MPALPICGYVSTAFWCPYDGKVAPEKAADVIERLADMGVTDVSIGDTIGKAQPDEVRALLDVVLKRVEPNAWRCIITIPSAELRIMFFSVMGLHGITIYDACTGGIGGCPYAPGAAGNVATSTVVKTLRAGADVPLDLLAIERAKNEIIGYLGMQRQPDPTAYGASSMTEKRYWLMKSEPDAFPEDLKKSPKKTSCWEGVAIIKPATLCEMIVRRVTVSFFITQRPKNRLLLELQRL